MKPPTTRSRLASNLLLARWLLREAQQDRWRTDREYGPRHEFTVLLDNSLVKTLELVEELESRAKLVAAYGYSL